MPTALPAAAAFTGAGVTEGQFKTALTDTRTFLADLLGTDGVPATARAQLGFVSPILDRTQPGDIGGTTRAKGGFSLVGIGTAANVTVSCNAANTDLQGISQGAYSAGVTAGAAATSLTYGFYTSLATAAAAFTCAGVQHFTATDVSKGAGSTITTQTGFLAADLAQGGTNYGFRGQVSAAASKWNAYMDGTAKNYFAGKTQIGSATEESTAVRLEIANTGATNTLLTKNNNAASATDVTWNSATSGDNVFAAWMTEGTQTQRGTVDYNRAGGAVRYNTTSDANVKNILGDADPARSLEILRTSKLRAFEYIENPGRTQIGPIAQELALVYNGAVSKGGIYRRGRAIDYRQWAVDKTAYVWHMLAGWQDHDARLAKIEAKLAAAA